MRIALDVMGGDFAPAAAVEGAVLYARETGDEVVLVGPRDRIERELATRDTFGLRLPVHHASQVVEMGDRAGQAIRAKKDSSLRVCFELVRRGEVAAMLSAGHSGALMAGALLVLGRLPGVERPCFAAVFPTVRGRAVMVDVGANTDCKPIHLVQFALMAEAYARKMMGFASPRLGVLSNGEEETKGTELTRKALERLRALELPARYVEGKELLLGEVEVVVTDGFTGNVVLKALEGVPGALARMLREEVGRRVGAQAGYLLMRPALAAFKRRIDPDEIGGAPLIGVNGVAVVAHGRSEGYAIKQALKQAAGAARVNLSAELSQAAARAGPGLHRRAVRG